MLPSKSRSNEGSFIGLSAEPSAPSPPLTGAPGAASTVKLVDSHRGGSSRSEFAFDGRGSGRSCDSSLEDDEDSKRGGLQVDVDASHGHGGEEEVGEEEEYEDDFDLSTSPVSRAAGPGTGTGTGTGTDPTRLQPSPPPPALRPAADDETATRRASTDDMRSVAGSLDGASATFGVISAYAWTFEGEED